MSSIGIDQQDRVRQVVGQPVRVSHRNHLVVDAVHHKRGLANGSQIGKSLAFEGFPLTECRYLSGRDLRTRGWIEVVFALGEPLDKGLTQGLTRGRRCEEDLFQNVVSSVRWILNGLRQAR